MVTFFLGTVTFLFFVYKLIKIFHNVYDSYTSKRKYTHCSYTFFIILFNLKALQIKSINVNKFVQKNIVKCCE